MSGGSSDEGEAPMASNTVSDYKAQRGKANEILKLLTKNATNYELLGVSRDATKQQILSAWKSAIAGIHPDKNKDSDSKRCAQGMCYVTRHLLHANLILILLCPSYQPSKRHITQPSNTSSTRQRYCRKPSAPCDNDF